MLTIFTNAGRALIADKIANAETLAIDKIVFADIDGLDTSVAPDPAVAMPDPADIMLNTDIDISAKDGSDLIVYSKTLGANLGDWYINWIGLYSTADATLVAVCHVPRHLKYATDEQTQLTGNVLYKHIALHFANAADIAAITIDAAAWQLDLAGNYALADHDHDDRYYTKAVLDAALAGKSDTDHGHAGMVPAGTVVSLATDTVPDGWLECDGAVISRTAYADLFAVVGTTFGEGDGVSTFQLPDLRDEFIRGWNHARAFGSLQLDSLKSHRHLGPVADEGTDLFAYGASYTGGGLATHNPDDHAGTTSYQGYTSYEGDAETRPRNIALMFCIRY